MLAQRKHIFREMKLPHMEEICITIHKQFIFIRDWSYWRHCLQVKNVEQMLIMILPSDTGGHAKVREHMLELITHCKEVSSMTSAQYEKFQAKKSLKENA